MGDIKRIRKKYEAPAHPWNKERIEQETGYKKLYGLRNKKEIWKAETILKNIKDQIKSFPSMSPEQAALREEKLRGRLVRLGLIDQDSDLTEVLGFSAPAILDRRLQTIVHNKDLARSTRQARQFIIHEHILVGERCVSAPGYLVTKEEEQNITFRSKSPLFAQDHPERTLEDKHVEVKTQTKLDEKEEPEVVELTEEDKQLD